MTSRKWILRIPEFLRRVYRNNRGIALTEFAVVAPVLLTLALFGFEIAYMAIAKTKVSQIALSVADNASRLGQTDNGAVVPTITENDVNAVLLGASIEGRSINFADNARLILSSLEYDPIADRQFIHWQRCFGNKEVDSAYGNDTDDNGLTGDELEGMGAGASRITAPPGEAVMFVEVIYDHTPVFSNAFVGNTRFREEAAFIIRDDRNLRNPDENGLIGTVQNEC